MRKRLLTSLLFIVILLNTGNPQALAQTTVSKWLRNDVNINIQQNSGILVEEIHEVSLISGATTFSRVIPTDQVESVSNVTVMEVNPSGGQRSYQAADSGADYTFQTVSAQDQLSLQLHFPPNNVASTRFVIKYLLGGSLALYDDGDEFGWQPFGQRTPAPIDSATIVLNLPGSYTDSQISRENAGFANVNNFFSEPNRVTFKATNIPAGSEPVIKIKFPHSAVQGNRPQWQNYVDTTAYWRPILQWGSVSLGLLLSIGGLLAVYGWWYMRVRVAPGRDVKTPKYLKAPPSDLSPAVVGTLLDGKVAPKHMLASLLDLAQRGALNVEPARSSLEHDSTDAKKEEAFDLYGLDQEKATRPYETTLFTKIFGHMGGKKRPLSEIHKTVHLAIPELKKQIEFEIFSTGYFSENATVTRRQYSAFGGAGVLISLVLVLLAAVLLGGRFTYLVVCPFLALTAGALGFIAVGMAAPKKTKAGATEAVRWEAFKRYLNDMGVKHAAKIRSRFPRLLPYAVAFGIEEEFVKKFSKANAPAPKWWGKPEEKLPDMGHSRAHKWVAQGTETQPQQSQAESTTTGTIRRLNDPARTASDPVLLKQINGPLLAFLNAATELFAKAPPLDAEETVEFDAFADQ